MMSPENCSSLHGFLLAIPLIETLHEMKGPMEGNTMEEVQISALDRRGYERCMANIMTLANRGGQTPIQSPFVDVSLHDQRVTQNATND
jgi:hypothetical protein